jgi:hypothetical protein
MKKLQSIVFFTFFLLTFASAQKEEAIDPEKIKWKNYTTADKLLRARIPKDWEPDEKFMTFNLFVKAPYETDGDRFAENISVYYQELKAGTPEQRLTTYVNEAKIQITRLLGEGEMTTPRFFSLRGVPACEYTCVSTQDGMKLKWKQLCLIKGDRIFTLTFTAAFEDFSRYVHVADIVMQSLEIK